MILVTGDIYVRRHNLSLSQKITNFATPTIHKIEQ